MTSNRLGGLFTALINTVIEEAFARCTLTGRPIDPPLLLCLDEAANVAPLPNLAEIAATAAGQGVQVLSVFQNLSQISERWGRERADTLIANHTARLFGSGIADRATLDCPLRLGAFGALTKSERTGGSAMTKVPGPQVVTSLEAAESALPAQIGQALGELVGAARQGLLALSVGVGLGVVHELMQLEVEEVVGPKGKHNPDRVAKRHGHEDGSMTLGGRRVAVRRPRIRSADDERELEVATYECFADRDPLTRAVMNRMLAASRPGSSRGSANRSVATSSGRPRRRARPRSRTCSSRAPVARWRS
jgi:hypothetical protein